MHNLIRKALNAQERLIQSLIVVISLFSNKVSAVTGADVFIALDTPQYIVSLTSDEGVDPLSLKGSQEIRVVVLTDRLSKRKWKNQWNNNININNDISSLSANVNGAIAHFLSFPDGRMERGDTVVLTYNSESGTIATFNGHRLVNVPGAEFFSTLKNVFVGQYPPSREFRKRLLGKIPMKEESERLLTYAPTESRVEETKSWVMTSEELERRKDERQRLEKIEREKKIAKIKAEQQEKANEKRRRKIEEEKLIREKRRQDELIAKKKREQIRKEREAKRLAEIKEQKLLAEKKAKEKKYALDMYNYQVIDMLYKRVQYPTWARKFEIEGTVDITAKISTDGELLDITKNITDTNRKLVKEVETKLRDVVSFVPMPTKYIEDAYSIHIQYTFDLRNKQQKENIKPKTW
jgi:hypothetical protein